MATGLAQQQGAIQNIQMGSRAQEGRKVAKERQAYV
jgi:hypothetical protein